MSKFNAETSTNLTGSASRNGASYDTQGSGVRGHYTRFRALAAADQTGTLKIQQSDDGTNWYETATQAVTAGTTTSNVTTVAVTVESLIVMRYVRAAYTNGSSAQGAFKFATALVP